MDSKTAHGFSRNNKEAIERSGMCACFHCLKSFHSMEVTEWTDGGQTAVCPVCSVDSVLGDSQPVPLDEVFLVQMNLAWF